MRVSGLNGLDRWYLFQGERWRWCWELCFDLTQLLLKFVQPRLIFIRSLTRRFGLNDLLVEFVLKSIGTLVEIEILLSRTRTNDNRDASLRINDMLRCIDQIRLTKISEEWRWLMSLSRGFFDERWEESCSNSSNSPSRCYTKDHQLKMIIAKKKIFTWVDLNWPSMEPIESFQRRCSTRDLSRPLASNRSISSSKHFNTSSTVYEERRQSTRMFSYFRLSTLLARTAGMCSRTACFVLWWTF